MIIIDTETTSDAVKLVEGNLGNLGKIISVEHARGGRKIGYQTIITGEDHTIRVDGGLSSGYPGEGPKGLIKVLELLGLSNETAIQLVDANREDNKHSFKHSF